MLLVFDGENVSARTHAAGLADDGSAHRLPRSGFVQDSIW